MARKQLPIPVERIENAILVIRGERVLPDKDLALLYRVSTSGLNKSVPRNIERFHSDFMFHRLLRSYISN